MNNMEDFEIDSLLENSDLFKPLTDGLGFHHSLKKEKEVAVSLKQKSLDLKSDLDLRAKTLYASQPQSNIEKKSINPTSMGELSAFYSNPVEEKIEIQLNSESTSKITLEADLFPRFTAWLMDTAIVISLISIIAISAIFTSGIPFSFFRDNIYNLDIAFFVFAFSAMFNIFYFSFFDKTKYSTPGKRALGLRVQKLNGKEISLIQSLNRSLISILSLATFGLFSYLKLQDRLTDTVVVSK